ncbi:polysaccharide deacetylase family protein [Chenggangzhangella methanolivorans]|uniref:polysaccharide deacetylase family protein n=1 Tax=Chenggangzhangella methanolivorans TaxID=1437009 RepID=UPI0036105021
MKHAALIALGFLALASAPAAAGDFEPRLSFAAEAGPRTVALTFDACAGGFDRRVMDALIAANARATIFVTERWLKKNAAALAEIKARPDLFEIENHGKDHVPAVTDAATMFGIRTAATIEGVRTEIEGGAKAIETATGKRPSWYRGATARYSRDAMELSQSLGMKVAGYSLNADMGASLPAASVARRMAAARSGDVVIAHINQPGRPAGQGVADGVRALAASGARFVKLDEVQTKSDEGAPVVVARRKPAAPKPAGSEIPPGAAPTRRG